MVQPRENDPGRHMLAPETRPRPTKTCKTRPTDCKSIAIRDYSEWHVQHQTFHQTQVVGLLVVVMIQILVAVRCSRFSVYGQCATFLGISNGRSCMSESSHTVNRRVCCDLHNSLHSIVKLGELYAE